jgi:toxin LF subunit
MRISHYNFLAFSLLLVLMLCVTWPVAAQDLDTQKTKMLERTDALLEAIEGIVLTDLKEEEQELRQEADAAKSKAMGNAAREAVVKAQDEAMRAKARELAAKIDSWARGGKELIESLSAEELNEAMAEARGIAKYFGLDVKRLGRLYKIGKKTIKDNQFILSGSLPPNEDESYARYFSDFFTFAHNREVELSKYRDEQQEYRLTLFKRVTLAYIRALLASTEPIPPCKKDTATKIVKIGRQSVKSFGCKDPVVENLRGYVQAVQQIASADADRFTAEAEMVVERQVLASDMAAAIPLVGDAIDFYNLYAGENLAGQCLSNFEYGLTAVFAAIPFLPSGWATQVVKRMGLEDYLSRIILFMSQSSFYSEEMLVGLFKRFGIEKELWEAFKEGLWMAQLAMSEVSIMPEFPKGSKWVKDSAEKFGIPEEKLQKVWDFLNKEITFPGGAVDEVVVAADGVVSNRAAESLSKPLNSDAALQRNIKQATEDQKYLRNLAPEYLAKSKKIARQRLDKNLFNIRANKMALAGDFTEVKKLSNIVPDHADTISDIMKEKETVVGMRYVNPFSTEKIAQDFATKPMPVKPKSSDFGPQAAFLPVDQKFSKLGNPKNPKPDKILKFNGIVQDCLQKGPCEQTNLILANGDEVMVWKKGPKGEMPIVKRGDKYVDYDTGKVLNVDPKDAEPMSVIALPHPETKELIPVTADYDMLIVGGKADVQVPRWKDDEGFISDIETDFKVTANQAFRKRNNYGGGDLIHHGPEAQYTGSPGAFADDPLVTMFDPDIGGPITIPRCEGTCMENWCKTTKQCGNIPVCSKGIPKTPCMQIDPSRLLKDYLHLKRMNGYTGLSPNSAWRWGEHNGLGGWQPKVVLDTAGNVKEADWVFGQYTMELGIKQIKRKALGFMGRFKAKALQKVALEATEMLFSCPGAPIPKATQ